MLEELKNNKSAKIAYKMNKEIDSINRKWYRKVYRSIVSRARKRGLNKKTLKTTLGYFEIHHILPKCLGGSDNDYNKCALTYKEHFICHKILCRLFPSNYWLHSSFYLMSHIDIIENGKKIKKSVSLKTILEFREFSKIHKKPRLKRKKKVIPKVKLKKRVPKEIAQKNRTQGIRDYYKRVGGHRSEETKEKLRIKNIGKIISKESIEKAKATRISHGGWIVSEETKDKIRKKAIGREHLSSETRNKMSSKYGFKIKYVDSLGNEFIYDSMTKAASAIGKSIKYIKTNASKNLNGLSFIGNTEMIQRQIIGPDGTVYPSISNCAKTLNKTRSTILDWINKGDQGYKYL